eukprot:365907-Chlamydomonas_euryale.AAC.14
MHVPGLRFHPAEAGRLGPPPCYPILLRPSRPTPLLPHPAEAVSAHPGYPILLRPSRPTPATPSC